MAAEPKNLELIFPFSKLGEGEKKKKVNLFSIYIYK